jgi:copper(I)-binding protein
VMLTAPVLACDLKVDSAWIRVAPGNAKMLAGYAVLSNTGGKPLGVVSAQSAAFDRVELHESLTENGIAKMRPIDKLEIAAGGSQTFEPGGKHFMLINPKAALRGGDVVAVKFKDSAGCETTVSFKVGGAAPQHQH